jgi:hypothetical protein
VGQLGASVLVGDLTPLESLIGLDDLAHPLLDPREIIGVEGSGGLEVVIEAVLDGWSDAEQGPGKKILNRLGHHMGGRVPQHSQTFIRTRCHRLNVGVLRRRPRQVA